MADLLTAVKQTATAWSLWLEQWSVPELIYRGATGNPSPVYGALQDVKTAQEVAGAGGGRGAIDLAMSDAQSLRAQQSGDAAVSNAVQLLLVGGILVLSAWAFWKFYKAVL